MNALVVAALCFFAACLSVLVARSRVASAGALLVWLGPAVTAFAAGGLYYWYEARAISSAPSGTASSAMAPGRSRELNEMAKQLTNKLGQDAASAAEAPKRDAGDLRELSTRLAEKLERDPQNGPGWTLLARSYANTGRFGEAEQAFEKAAKLQPNDAALLADWAEASVMAHERKWDQRAAALVQQALRIDPRLPKALALAGTETQLRGDYKQAAAYWARLKEVAQPGSAEAREADTNMMEMKSRSSGKSGASPRP